MFIEIRNLCKSKKLLIKVYQNVSKYVVKENKKYMQLKYRHSNDCLKILKCFYPLSFFKYASAILLHDIGRFFEYKKIDDFDHAYYGYNYLNENFTNDYRILLPIKYHEKNLNWLEELYEDNDYIKCSVTLKKQIIFCSELLRDIDVISNMEYILKKNDLRKVKNINYELVNKLMNGILGEQDDIKNNYDEIVYILCGLKIIKNSKSFRYLKKYKIIEYLINRLFLMIETTDVKSFEVTLKLKQFINDNYIKEKKYYGL